MNNFAIERANLIEERNTLMETILNDKDNLNYADVKNFTKRFKDLFEALVFDLLSTGEQDFFGNVLVNIGRKFNYCIISSMNHQVVGMQPILHVNPFLFLNYEQEEMKQVIIHELYHILQQHSRRTQRYVENKVPTKIVVIACDIVVNKELNLNNNLISKWYTYERLTREFGITLNKENTVEENIKSLIEISKINEKFANFVNDFEEIEESDIDFEDDETLELLNEALEEFMSVFSVKFSNATELDLMDDFIRKVIVESASNSRGMMPSGVKQILDELVGEPKIAWQKILAKRLGSLPVPYKKSIVRNDRRMPERLDLKGRISDRVAKLYVGIDTSGSVSDEEIEYILNEIDNIAKVYKATVTVGECDAAVQRVYDLKSRTKAKRDIEGRGGTAFAPMLTHFKEECGMAKDSILIYFTDGGGERTIPKVGCNIIWVLTRGEELSVENPQGRILKLQDDDKFMKRNR